MRHFLIDTDTASDDAVALVMAFRHPNIKIEAITIVAGNVPLQQGVQNALYVRDLCGGSAPVFEGAAKPMLRQLETAQFVHGKDGMGDIGLDLAGRTSSKGHAVDAILDTAYKLDGALEIVTIGPLTNIAIALLKDPTLVHKVRRCVVMGGVGQGHGNITPVSEYNIWTDPEAARIVFDSGMPITMVGWDISRKYAFFDQKAIAAIRSLDTALVHFAIDIQGTLQEFSVGVSKLPGFDLPDPIAMAIALDPKIVVQSKSAAVDVICADGVVRGQTVIDHNGLVQHGHKVEVVLEASREKFIHLLHRALNQK
ncbi:MAG: nucleoside hydrolase [Saprospiraceae bacterium]|nr:nucleoside hydrolase [Saprospiraceae bacterium]